MHYFTQEFCFFFNLNVIIETLLMLVGSAWAAYLQKKGAHSITKFFVKFLKTFFYLATIHLFSHKISQKESNVFLNLYKTVKAFVMFLYFHESQHIFTKLDKQSYSSNFFEEKNILVYKWLKTYCVNLIWCILRKRGIFIKFGN